MGQFIFIPKPSTTPILLTNNSYDNSGNNVSYDNNGNYLHISLNLASTFIPSSVTYGGVSMVKLGSQFYSTFNRSISVWGLANPPQGNNTLSATVAGYTINYWWVMASFTGVNQDIPFSNFSSGTSTGQNPALSVTASSDGSRIIGGYQASNYTGVGSGTSLVQEGVGTATYMAITTDVINSGNVGTVNYTTSSSILYSWYKYELNRD